MFFFVRALTKVSISHAVLGSLAQASASPDITGQMARPRPIPSIFFSALGRPEQPRNSHPSDAPADPVHKPKTGLGSSSARRLRIR